MGWPGWVRSASERLCKLCDSVPHHGKETPLASGDRFRTCDAPLPSLERHLEQPCALLARDQRYYAIERTMPRPRGACSSRASSAQLAYATLTHPRPTSTPPHAKARATGRSLLDFVYPNAAARFIHALPSSLTLFTPVATAQRCLRCPRGNPHCLSLTVLTTPPRRLATQQQIQQYVQCRTHVAPQRHDGAHRVVLCP